MARRKPPNRTNAALPVSKPLWVTWNDNDPHSKQLAFSQAAKNITTTDGVVLRSTGTAIYEDIAPGNVSVREGMDRRDYDWFRPSERLPEFDRDIMLACQQAYDRIGIVHNVIDMMSDFAVQGIRLEHVSPQIRAWHQEWFKLVKGPERTERMLNMFYRLGNVVIRRGMAKINDADANRIRQGRVTASNSLTDNGANLLNRDIKLAKPKKVEPLLIPWEYTILNPITVEVVGGELAPFLGTKAFRFGVRVPERLLQKLRDPNKEVWEKDLVGQVPFSSLPTYSLGGKIVPLNHERVITLYYKKDDSQIWAKPMINCILADLQMLVKLKLADLAALDGATSHIRLWRLGNLEHKMLPTEFAVERLATMLLNNVGGGGMDLIWGPDLDFIETSTDLGVFLGMEKYEPTLESIFQGLGVPRSINGGGEAGFSNNYFGLQTLMQRLQYGRDRIIEMWEKELTLLQQAMGFREPAKLVFDIPSLVDPANAKRLLIELYDRDIISLEEIQERFDLLPEIEKVRRKREQRARDNGSLPRKSGPWNNPEQKEALEKIFAQTGELAPSELGLDLPAKKVGETSPREKQDKRKAKMDAAKPKIPGAPKGEPGQGRPPLSNDKVKRKKKDSKPRVSVKAGSKFVPAFAWALETQEQLAELVNPPLLASFGKKNMRQLTDDEAASAERLRFSLLLNTPLYGTITEDTVATALGANLPLPSLPASLVREVASQYRTRTGKEPGVDQLRRFQAGAYALWATGCTEPTEVST